MIKTIRSLEAIQKIDLEVLRIGEEEKSYASKIEAADSEIKKAESELSAASAEAEDVFASVKRLDDKIREDSERVARDEKRLNSIKNDRELNALTKEINGANRSKKQCEQEKANVVSRLDSKRAAIDSKKAFIEERRKELSGLTSELEAKRPAWKETLSRLAADRLSLASSISPEILKKYEMIRSRRSGIGLVPVRGEICQGCFTHIPPQVYIQIKKGIEELFFCPHCHRILFAEQPEELQAV